MKGSTHEGEKEPEAGAEEGSRIPAELVFSTYGQRKLAWDWKLMDSPISILLSSFLSAPFEIQKEKKKQKRGAVQKDSSQGDNILASGSLQSRYDVTWNFQVLSPTTPSLNPKEVPRREHRSRWADSCTPRNTSVR